MEPHKLYRLVTKNNCKTWSLANSSVKKVVGINVGFADINTAIGTASYTDSLSYSVPAGYAYGGYAWKKVAAFVSVSGADYIPSVTTNSTALDDSFSTYAVNEYKYAMESAVLTTTTPEANTVTFNITITKQGGGNIPGDLTAGNVVLYVILFKLG